MIGTGQAGMVLVRTDSQEKVLVWSDQRESCALAGFRDRPDRDWSGQNFPGQAGTANKISCWLGLTSEQLARWFS